MLNHQMTSTKTIAGKSANTPELLGDQSLEFRQGESGQVLLEHSPLLDGAAVGEGQGLELGDVAEGQALQLLHLFIM